MKAMVLKAPNEVSLADSAKPEVGSGETTVRVTHSGICGTDLKIFQGKIPVDYPRIMGHESVGEVIGSGDLVSGTRVLVDPVNFCGICYQCRAGQTQLCPNGNLIGRDIDGGFAEFVVVPTSHLYPLPDTVRSDQAPLIQPMTTCLHGQRLADIKPGEAVIIIGLGVTGLLHVQAAKARGADPVIGVTRSGWKRDLAENLGADMTFAPDDNVVGKVREATGDRGGGDVVIESVGSMAVLAQALEMTRLGGRVMPFGILTVTEGALPFYDFYFKEIQLVNARAAKPEDFPACIDLVDQGIVELTPLITDLIPLPRMATALEKLEASEGIKIILDHTTL